MSPWVFCNFMSYNSIESTPKPNVTSQPTVLHCMAIIQNFDTNKNSVIIEHKKNSAPCTPPPPPSSTHTRTHNLFSFSSPYRCVPFFHKKNLCDAPNGLVNDGLLRLTFFSPLLDDVFPLSPHNEAHSGYLCPLMISTFIYTFMGTSQVVISDPFDWIKSTIFCLFFARCTLCSKFEQTFCLFGPMNPTICASGVSFQQFCIIQNNLHPSHNSMREEWGILFLTPI